MHYQALYGKKKPTKERSATPKPVKMYNLFYNKQRLVYNAPYGVCAGKKKELLKLKGYQVNYFEILPN